MARAVNLQIGQVVKFWMIGSGPPDKNEFRHFQMATDELQAEEIYPQEAETKRRAVLIECIGEIKREQIL
jgi:hypothetical protein